nr:Uma2 family endonuclease [Polyangiaceae bacterium]
MTQLRWPGVSEHPPTRVEQLRDGDRYELSEGEAIYCAPAQPKHGAPHGLGTLPLGSDPAVAEFGVEVGHALGERTLRAPDVSVGELGGGEGWATKAPPLAVEYASQGQDEADLQLKIKQLLAAGTDREAAFEQTLQNLLARKGYAGLDAVLAEGEARGKAEGRAEGKAEGLREGEARGKAEGKAEGLREGKAAALLTVLAARGLAVDDETRARLEACADPAQLDRWLARALTAASARE